MYSDMIDTRVVFYSERQVTGMECFAGSSISGFFL
jgi:hypothetical protein